MINRLLNLPKEHTFFLFGPRQTGKSTLLKANFKPEVTLFYDLLKSDEYLRLSANPSLFRQEILARSPGITHVVVDEIQRIPELLNEIHHLIEQPGAPYFCLSGSSSRKLKRSHANLLGGRAWTFHLFPLTHQEAGGTSFSMDKALNFGTLPPLYLCNTREDAQRTLKSYVETYLKEEIQAEAIVRNLGGFLRFLVLAADENGNILNYSNLARETGTNYQTIKDYFQILEDTLIGFFLLPYSRSTRKRLIKHPKFYFFDTGVQRALAKRVSVELQPKTFEFGNVFEHFMIIEIMRLAAYKEKDYRFSFYHSSTHAEVDLIVETPQGETYAIEIKSSENPDSSALKGLYSFQEICPSAKLYCVCLASRKRQIKNITIYPWRDIFEVVGLA